MNRITQTILTTMTAALVGVVLAGAPANAAPSLRHQQHVSHRNVGDLGATPEAFDAATLLMTRSQIADLFNAQGCTILSLDASQTQDGVPQMYRLYPTTTVGQWVLVQYRQTPDGVFRLRSKSESVDPYVNPALCYR